MSTTVTVVYGPIKPSAQAQAEIGTANNDHDQDQFTDLVTYRPTPQKLELYKLVHVKIPPL